MYIANKMNKKILISLMGIVASIGIVLFYVLDVTTLESVSYSATTFSSTSYPFYINITLYLLPMILLIAYSLYFHKSIYGKYIAFAIFPTILMANLYDIFNLDIAKIVTCIMLLLATINAFGGYKKKIFAIIAPCIGLAIELLNMFINSYSIGHDEYTVDIMIAFGSLKMIVWSVMYASLLLFVIFNKTTPVMIATEEEKQYKEKKKQERRQNATPEEALKYLMEEYERGNITSEEYQNRRAEILKNL